MYTANVNIAVILQIICLYCTNDFLVDGQVQIKTCENNTVNKQRNFQYKLLIHWYGILLIIILSLCKVNMNNLKHQFSVCYFCPYLKNVYIHIIWTLNMKFSHLLKNVGWNSNKVFSRLHLKITLIKRTWSWKWGVGGITGKNQNWYMIACFWISNKLTMYSAVLESTNIWDSLTEGCTNIPKI